jgi:hypothetical protein
MNIIHGLLVVAVLMKQFTAAGGSSLRGPEQA